MILRYAEGMKCLELVVYTIRAGSEEEFLRIYGLIRKEMSVLPGFHSAETLRSCDDRNTYADVWMWDSIEEAKAAHAAFSTLPHASAFIAVVERVHYSSHFVPAL